MTINSSTQLFKSLGLSFSPEMLRWTPRESLQLGGLGDEQAVWYRRVLSSTGLQPATSEARPIDAFPRRFQPHLQECMSIYQRISSDPQRILP